VLSGKCEKSRQRRAGDNVHVNKMLSSFLCVAHDVMGKQKGEKRRKCRRNGWGMSGELELSRGKMVVVKTRKRRDRLEIQREVWPDWKHAGFSKSESKGILLSPPIGGRGQAQRSAIPLEATVNQRHAQRRISATLPYRTYISPRTSHQTSTIPTTTTHIVPVTATRASSIRI
jgi:hypothetical protein